MTVDIITMGCSKNLVDSQQLGQMFRERGVQVRFDPEDVKADVAVVNTCGFIGDAKEESINMILELCQAKADGRIGTLCVMGCLSERYRKELTEEIPEVDRLYGKFDWNRLAEDIAPDVKPCCLPAEADAIPVGGAYIKISEGCDRKCAYCAIPIITGRHKSRPMEDILAEVEHLASKGVKEFQVIAQELTFYGVDLYGRQRIAELIERMAHILGVEWIRLHYAYPNQFPRDLLRVIRENENVCNYLDIALQHISDNILMRMRRHVTRQETLDLLKLMREEVPGLCLRTTLMVGFPGETEEDFAQLVDFVREARFDRMGAFAYSEEEGTYAAEHYTDDVPGEIKQARLDKLMRVQQRISTEIGQKKVGLRLKTMIDRLEGDYYIGRTEYDSPEVDGEVLIPASENLQPGTFYDILITDADEFDLYGTSAKQA